MPYTKLTLRTAVRSMLQNVGSASLDDAKLDVLLAQAKRRLDRDKPNVATTTIAGTGKKFYQLTTTVVGWMNQFSTIQIIQNPKVVIANDDVVQLSDPKDIEIVEQDSLEYLRLDTGIASGTNALVKFTTPWLLDGIDGATSTTIPSTLYNALEFISASVVCLSLSAKSAGQLDDQIEADLINWRGKQAEYKFAARDFEENYLQEIGLDKSKVRAVMLRMDYDRDPQRISYLTHGGR